MMIQTTYALDLATRRKLFDLDRQVELWMKSHPELAIKAMLGKDALTTGKPTREYSESEELREVQACL